MDVMMSKGQVVLTMTPEEWNQLKSRNAPLRHAVLKSVRDEDRTFGGGQLDEGNELKVLEQRLEALGRLVGSEFSETRIQAGKLESRISNFERRLSDEVTTVNAMRVVVHEIRENYVTEVGFQDLISRIRRIEEEPRFDHRQVLERITALENGSRLVGTGSLGDITEAQAGLRSRMDWIQETQAEVQNAIERRLTSIENELTGVLTKPVDMVHTEAEIQAIKERIKTEPMKVLSEPVRYLSDEQTLNVAERRIREAMNGHFSEATIGGVVRALRGEEDPFRVGAVIQKVVDHTFWPTQKGGEGPWICGWTNNLTESMCGLPNEQHLKIADHAFRPTASDRRHCSYRVGHGQRCDRPQSDHTTYEVQPRPIKDQPQA